MRTSITARALKRRLSKHLGLALSLTLTLPWMAGCSSVKQSLGLQRMDTKAPVVSAQVKPAASVTGALREDLQAAALIERNPTGIGAPDNSLRVSPASQAQSQARRLQLDDGIPPAPPLSRQWVPDTLDDEGKNAAGAPTDPLRPDTTLNLDDRSAKTDLWGRVRTGFALPELDSELVADHQRWYASRPDYVQRMAERGSRYLYHVVEEVERRQMPTELALLPFIESAFNPQAMSSARASGIWQFMPATGKDYELKQNLFRDDRRDVLASTRAALDYLQRLYRLFGDWHLALAAYNWGEGNVQKAINRNLKAGLPTDYLSLNMPPETRNYVPKLHAVRSIVARPDAYGLSLPAIENHPYFVSVPLQRDLDVALAARLADMPLNDFQALNPSMNKPVILAAGTPQVLLPYNNASRFVHNLSSHKGPLATWTAWVVPRTMRPGDAARQVGMSESNLRDINHIPQRMLVKAGSTLLVPRSHTREQDVSESVADNAMMALAPDLPPMRRMVVRAGKRDSVSSLARRYKVNTAQLAQWNKVSAGATFGRGQSVVVFVPVRQGKQATRAVANNGRAQTRAVVAQAPARATSRMASVRAPVRLASKSERRVVSSSKAAGARNRAPVNNNRQKVRVATAR